MIPSSRSASSPIGQPCLQSLPDELLDDLFVRLGAGEASVLACVSRALSSAYKRFKKRRVERLRRQFRLGAVVTVDVDLGGNDHWDPHGNRWAMRDGTVALVPYRRENVDHDSLVVVRLWAGCSSSTYPLDGSFLEGSFSVSEGGRMVSVQTFVRGTVVLTRNISSMVFEVGRSGLRLLSTTRFVVSWLKSLPAPQFVGSQLLSLWRDLPTSGFSGPYDIHLWDIPHTVHDDGSAPCKSHRVACVPYVPRIRNHQVLALLAITARILRATGGPGPTVDAALQHLFGSNLRDSFFCSSRGLTDLVSGSTYSLLLQSTRTRQGRKGILASRLLLTPLETRIEPVWASPAEHSIIQRAVLLSNESVIARENCEGEPVTFLRTRDGTILGRHDLDHSSRALPAQPMTNSSNLLVARWPDPYAHKRLQLYDLHSREVCGEVAVLTPQFPSAVCDDRVVCFISATKLHVVFL